MHIAKNSEIPLKRGEILKTLNQMLMINPHKKGERGWPLKKAVDGEIKKNSRALEEIKQNAGVSLRFFPMEENHTLIQ